MEEIKMPTVLPTTGDCSFLQFVSFQICACLFTYIYLEPQLYFQNLMGSYGTYSFAICFSSPLKNKIENILPCHYTIFSILFNSMVFHCMDKPDLFFLVWGHFS